MNIVFFGTPEFVLPIPQALLKTKDHKLNAIITAPDRPVGRHKIPTPSPAKTWATEKNIPVVDLDSMIQVIEKIQQIKPQLGILAAYGKIIPRKLMNLFPKGILVIHPSLLPKYRGATPVPAAILAGEKETGVTILKMDEDVDHGPIVSQFKEEIKSADTAESLLERLFSQAAKVLATILPDYLEGRIKPREQNHAKATYTKTLTREDGYIDLDSPPPPEVVERMIRAYYPWPGVWSRLPSRSHLVRGETSQGKIVKFLPGEKIQFEGGKPMSVKDFLNGYPETKEWVIKLFP